MMSNEELDRKMALIVNQQAQFAVDIDKLRQGQTETKESIDRLVAAQAKTEETVTQLAAAQIKTEAAQIKTQEVVTRLAYVTNEGFKDVNANIDALVNSQIALQDSQKQTDEKLRQLTKTLDRHFKNRHNGGG